MKRGPDDLQWLQLKEKVKRRDSGCRLLRLLTVREFVTLTKHSKRGLTHCDPAHVFAVGSHPHMCYLEENVVTLNRFSHDCLDNCQNPLTGEPITKEERDGWWERIVGKETYQYLLDISLRREENERTNIG